MIRSFGGGIQVGRIFGIPINISYSWFFILAVVAWLLSDRLRDTNPSWSAPEVWLIGSATSLLFFASVLVHELSHSVLAVNRGIPVTGITLFIFGGISQIGEEARSAMVEFLIAGVGPLSSFILGGAFVGLYFVTRDFSVHLSEMCFLLAFINFSLGVFNMLPGFPLDGGRVLRSFLWGVTGSYWKATFLAARGGQVVGILLIVGGMAMLLFLREFQGLWMAAVGWFLAMAASSSLTQYRMKHRLGYYKAGDLMSKGLATAPVGISLETLATEYFLRSRQDIYFVMDGKRCVGMITFRALSRVPRGRWELTPLADAMRPLADVPQIDPDSPAVEALELIEKRRFPVVAVMLDEELLGYLTQQGAVKAMNIREAME